MPPPSPSGRHLYQLWCRDPRGVTDRFRYFDRMNPGDKAAWDRLAEQIASDRARLEVALQTIAEDRVRTDTGQYVRVTAALQAFALAALDPAHD